MKKCISVVVVLIMAICSLFAIGCGKGDSGIEKNALNSYIISIYKKIYVQSDDGKVVLKDYELWKEFNVLNTQMYKIPEYQNEAFAYGDGNRIDYYNVFKGDKYETENSLYIRPYNNQTIFVRERVKKTITLYYNGIKIYNNLSGEDKERYNEVFVSTYSESFSFNNIAKFIGLEATGGSIELYTNASCAGEPFATCTQESGRYAGSFTLIKSTNVYIKVVK